MHGIRLQTLLDKKCWTGTEWKGRINGSRQRRVYHRRVTRNMQQVQKVGGVETNTPTETDLQDGMVN